MTSGKPGPPNVVLAGALVRPGDVIVAADDGVLGVPVEEAPEVAAKALARESAERAGLEKFRAGELGLDLYAMRETLARLGVTYVDEPAPRAEARPEQAPATHLTAGGGRHG